MLAHLSILSYWFSICTPAGQLSNSSSTLSLDIYLHNISSTYSSSKLHSTAMATQLSETWKAIILRVANSFIGISGFSLLLYSLWMIGVCAREGKYSWFMFACLATGSSLCVIACLGYLGASGIASQLLLSIYIFLMFMVLTVEILVGADVILNKHWRKDFPKDRTGMFDAFVKYVESNDGVFRLIWILVALSQVMSFGLAMVLKFSDYRARIDNERLPLMGSQLRFVSNKYVEY